MQNDIEMLSHMHTLALNAWLDHCCKCDRPNWRRYTQLEAIRKAYARLVLAAQFPSRDQLRFEN